LYLVLGNTCIATDIRVLDLLDHEHAAHAIGLDLVTGILLNRLAIEHPGNFWSWVGVDLTDKLGITVTQLLDAVEGLGEEWSRVHLLNLSLAGTNAVSFTVGQVALIASTVSNIGINNLQTNELTIAEEVDSVSING